MYQSVNFYQTTRPHIPDVIRHNVQVRLRGSRVSGAVEAFEEGLLQVGSGVDQPAV
jgi:hypothetical protein